MGSILSKAADREIDASIRQQAIRSRSDRDSRIGDWADDRLVLPRGSAPTPYSQAQTPYWRHWLDIARARLTGTQLDHDPHAHETEQLYLTCANQLGKTQGLLFPILAYAAAVYPRAMALVMPRHDDLRRAQGTRVRPFFEQNACLRDLLPPGQGELERRLGSKTWRLATCDLQWLCGGAAGDLRTYDLPLILADEFDILPMDCERQGDPLELLLDRQKTFPWQRLLAGVTTPTTVFAHGWKRLCMGSHERLHVRCDKCGAQHWLDSEQLQALDGCAEFEIIRRDDLAAWFCPVCEQPHRTADLRRLVAAACHRPGWTDAGGWLAGTWHADDHSLGGGIWQPCIEPDPHHRYATPPPISNSIRTGHLGTLASSFVTAGEFLAHQLKMRAAGSTSAQSHANGWDGLPWAPAPDALDEASIENVVPPDAADYHHGSCPEKPWRVVCTFDQQGITAEKSWFPYVVRAWLRDGRSFLIESGRVDGFAGCENLIARAWPMGGEVRGVDCCSVDTANGPMVRAIRQWCARDQRRRLSIGGSGSMAPENPWSEMRATGRNQHKLAGCQRAWYFNANLFRDELHQKIKGSENVENKTWYIPSDAPGEYIASLQSEERVVEPGMHRGRREIRATWRPREWTDERGQLHVRRDNHWWDCEVMQLALVHILGWYGVTAPEGRARIVGSVR